MHPAHVGFNQCEAEAPASSFFPYPCQIALHPFFDGDVPSSPTPLLAPFFSDETLIPTLLAMCSNFAFAGDGLLATFLPGLAGEEPFFAWSVGMSLGDVAGDRLGEVPGGLSMPSRDAARRLEFALLGAPAKPAGGVSKWT